jgi:cell division protein FtsI/penicillin-binding protein 2
MAALIGAVALIARLVGLQLSPSTQLLEEGAKQRVKTIPLQATRGAIVDRNGADLAISVPQTTIAANPQAVVDPAGDAAKLAPILQRDPAELQTLLSSGKEFVYLARQTDDATAAAVKALGLKYVWTYDEAKRFLPSGDSLAVSVVGRTNVDTTGISGLEKQYDDVLRGTSGEEVVEQGRGGRTIPGGKQQIEPAHPGSTLVVSLDRGLQFEAGSS